jgi:hypothetical protein
VEVESKASRRREEMSSSSVTRDSDSAFIKANGSSHILIGSSCDVVSDRWNDSILVYSVYGCRCAFRIPYEVSKVEGKGIISCEGMRSRCSSDGFTTIDKRSNDVLICIRTWIVAYHTGWCSFIYSANDSGFASIIPIVIVVHKRE